jgi:ribonucleoside-diphosphate reductase alpha chain
MDNNKLIESNPAFETAIKALGDTIDFNSVMERIADEGSAHNAEELPESIRNIFVTAHDISPEWHIKTQAAFQRFIDNAVSKTVNFSHTATVEDIRKVYNMAYELECKGVTVYRDGSRDNQVLQISSSQQEKDVLQPVSEIFHAATPRPRHDVTWGATRKMNTGCGSLYVTINEDEQGIFEVFAAMGKGGGCAASQTEAIGRLISLSLRAGVDKEQIVKQLKGVRCPNQSWEKGGRIYSCSDAIAKAIERYAGIDNAKIENVMIDTAKFIAETNGKGHDNVVTGVCPDCHGPLEFESGCSVCRGCGFSRCG